MTQKGSSTKRRWWEGHPAVQLARARADADIAQRGRDDEVLALLRRAVRLLESIEYHVRTDR